MNKIVALTLVAGLGGEVGCRSEAQTLLEKQAVHMGADLDEVRAIRENLFKKLGVDFEGLCDNRGENPCTTGDPYLVQCALGGDSSNTYFNARDAAKSEVKKYDGGDFLNYFLNYSVDAVTQDGFSVNCVKSVIDTGPKSNID